MRVLWTTIFCGETNQCSCKKDFRRLTKETDFDITSPEINYLVRSNYIHLHPHRRHTNSRDRGS